MDHTENLWEVECTDGSVLVLGATTDWCFGVYGSNHTLPVLMWMHGVREDDDHIVLDTAEPFVDLDEAVRLAPEAAGRLLDASEALVADTGEEITVIGFGPRHPYRAELKQFLTEAHRLRRRLKIPTSEDVELTGRPTAATTQTEAAVATD